jgi:hypothetical protein
MDAKTIFVRFWNEVNVDEIQNHLLLIDDLYGTCAKCKCLGLNYLKDKKCKQCGTEFKYITTVLKNSGEVGKILQRIKREGLNLIMIDKEDFNKATAHHAAKDLFKSI